jgi:hypothetical protein
MQNAFAPQAASDEQLVQVQEVQAVQTKVELMSTRHSPP